MNAEGLHERERRLRARARKDRWAWLALFVLALVPRLIGIDLSASTPWGRPDEEIFVMRALGLFGGGIDPGVAHSGWPDAMFWLHHLFQRVQLAYWELRYGSAPNLGCVFALGPNQLILPVRVFCALLGAATPIVLGHAAMVAAPPGTAGAERRAVGFAAALFYAVNVLAVRDAHYAVSDTPTVFFLALLLLFGARAMAGGGMRDYAASGISLGLAMSIKWAALPFALIPVLGLGMRLSRRYGKLRTAKGGLVGLVTTSLAFVLGTPNFLVAPEAYISGVRSHAMRYDPNAALSFIYDASVSPSLGVETHAVLSLPYGFGWPLLVFAVCAALFAIFFARRHRAPALFVFAVYALFFYFAVVGRTTLNFSRYSLPVHPALAVVAAALLPMAVARIAPRLLRARPMATLLGAALVLALSPLLRTADVARLLAAPETRELASQWIRERVGDEPIVTHHGYHALYAVDARLASACQAVVPEPLWGWVPRRDAGGGEAHLAAAGPSEWDLIADRSAHGQVFGFDPNPRGAHYAVVAQPVVPCGRGVTPLFAARTLPACFAEVARFDQGDVACDTVYDVMDHYYIPMSLDLGARRPGPEVVIYENRCDRR